MSEQEEKSGGGSGHPVMVVDTSASDKLGQNKPYRPTELESAPEPHKRSRAPAVPSVAEEFKNAAIYDSETLEKIEVQQSISSEKLTRRASSSTKRRVSSPEVIKMNPLDTAKKGLITPIPAAVETVASKEDATKLDVIKKADEDSITDEITELRTPEPGGQDRSEWSDDEEAGGLPRSESRGSRVSRAVRQLFCCGMPVNACSEDELSPRPYHALPHPVYQITACQERYYHENLKSRKSYFHKDPLNPTHSKKKEISWGDSEYLDKIRLEESAKAKRCQSIFRDLNAKSQAAILERKPSIGPCFKASMLGGRSGISICVPKKSIRTMKEEFNPMPSVIDINISMKNTPESTCHLSAPKKIPKKLEKEVLQVPDEQQQIKFLDVIRTKLDNMSSKIRNLLNM